MYTIHGEVIAPLINAILYLFLKLMLAIESILKLWKVLDLYFVMYISATAALYSEMYSFGKTLVIWSF